jgi:ring-1,2-phenylacetyl-CoA epoxidase subunit PaaE
VAKHFRPLTILDIRNETDDCISVSFHVPDEWKEEFKFTAGQNITLRTTIGSEEVRRSYSILQPFENELRSLLKAERVYFLLTYVHFRAKQALDVLKIWEIYSASESSQQKHVAFAAGSITPCSI